MPFATNIQALSATTAQVINGNKPYLTFDNGITKVTDTNSLLSITISDGTTHSTYTPENNMSTADNPIALAEENQSFADIGMLVPSSTNSITLDTLIGAPNNYWGDDDGDGQGTNGVNVSGSLSISITDKYNQAVSRNAILDICKAPYKLVLTSTDGRLTTQYGTPNSLSFRGSNATYYIKPKAAPKVCYARPNLTYGSGDYAGPANIWNESKGFLVQSTAAASYGTNFPTTGAHNMYFELEMAGIDGATLTWPTVTLGGITATMKVIESQPNTIRVTLTGPVASGRQHRSSFPGRVSIPSLPQQFELVGYDSGHTVVLKYGFVIKQWFVHRGGRMVSTHNGQLSWCSELGGKYRLVKVKDLTNAVCNQTDESNDKCKGAVGANPSSKYNFHQRNIGAGFFAEWGAVGEYTYAGFGSKGYYTTSSDNGDESIFFKVAGGEGSILGGNKKDSGLYGLCTYP